MSDKLQFGPFDDVTFAATETAWMSDAESPNIFLPEVEQGLEWVRKHTQHIDGAAMAYGVFDGTEPAAIGICEVVRPGGGSKAPLVKHLNLKYRPSLYEKMQANDTDSFQLASAVFEATIIGVFKLKLDHKVPTLKVYGRTKEQLNFLQQAAVAMKPVMKKHTVAVEGRFLVISDKDRQQ